MASREESAQALKGSDQVVDFSCTFCNENEGRITEAQFYCKQCGNFFCTDCVALHNRLYKKHAVRGRDDKDGWPVKDSNGGLEKCEEHPDKDIELFCEDHRRLCCLLCQFTHHRSCNRVVFVSEKEQGFRPTEDTRTIKSNIESQLQKVRNWIVSREKNAKSLQESYEKTSSDIKSLRKKFEEIFDKIEKNTVKNLDGLMGELKEFLESDIANLSKLDADLWRLNAAISIQEKKGDPLTFMMEMKYADRMSSSESILADLESRNKAVIAFECNAELRSFVSKLSSFGKCVISENPVSMNTTIRGVDEESAHIGQHSIRMPNERVCDIRGICELSNGTIVIADRSNNSIKVLGNSFQVVNTMKLSFPPNDICAVSSTKVAVAVNSKNRGQIIILKITKTKITEKNTFDFDHKCTSIVTSADSMYITTNTALLQYRNNADREFVKKIHEDTSSFLTVNKCTKLLYRQTVYLTNYNEHQLLAFSRNGNQEVITAGAHLVNPTGVHVTESGNVLVCSYSTNTVLNIDGHGRCIILAQSGDGVKRPQSVYYSKMSGDIIVGQGCNRLVVIKTKGGI